MSLQAHALAICATGAFAEVLPAWIRVVMEPHAPLELAETEQRILVAVYIGDETSSVTGRKWTLGTTTVELVVQIILPPLVRAELGEAVCEFDTRAGGTRPLYALVHEGLRRAFTAPEVGSWGELLQELFTHHPDPISGMPGRAERMTTPPKPPVPVIDYAIPCGVIMPPALGKPAPRPWPQIVAKMRADPAFAAEEADFLEALLAGAPLGETAADLALAGLSRRQAAALGLDLMPGADDATLLVEAVHDGAAAAETVTADAP